MPTTDEVDEVDVFIDNQGTIVAITPMTRAAREWLEDNCQTEPWQWLGVTLGVEHRYAGDIIEGLQEAGFTVGE